MGEKLTLACKDVGIASDCSFVAKGKNTDKLMAKAAKHLAKKHSIASLTPEQIAKATAAIKKTA